MPICIFCVFILWRGNSNKYSSQYLSCSQTMSIQELCNRIQYNIIIHHLRHSVQLHWYQKVISSNGHLWKTKLCNPKIFMLASAKKHLIKTVLRSWHLEAAWFLTFLIAVLCECKHFTDNFQLYLQFLLPLHQGQGELKVLRNSQKQNPYL